MTAVTPFRLAAVGLVVSTSTAAAFSSGPPDMRCGDPPDFLDCTVCHNEFELNSGDGLLELNGVPTTYVPDTTYMLEVVISDPDQVRWGFEMTAIADGVDEGGVLTSIEAGTQVSGTPGDGVRDYIKHTSAGTQTGEPFGSWEFEWTAPATGSGEVVFYLAGNAANNMFGNQGDYIYTITASVDEGVVAVGENGPVASVLRAFPNPSRSGAVTVSFDLEQPDEVGLFVIDAAGRLVDVRSPRAFGAGLAEFIVPTRNLVPGRYWVRAAGRFGSVTAPLTVLR